MVKVCDYVVVKPNDPRSWRRFSAVVLLAACFGFAGGRAHAQGCPAAPTNVTASIQSNCAVVHVTWDGDPEAESYSVYWAEHDSTSWNFVNSLSIA